MAHTETHDAIILKTYDVGEADRFCILFTRGRGRLAARAPAVRKLKSKMGGSLLLPHHVTVEMRESSAGWMIVSAQQQGDVTDAADVSAFVLREQGIELLLCLLHDEEALPEIFDLTLEFLENPKVLQFSIRLLYLLGLISLEFFGPVSEQEREFIQACISEKWQETENLPHRETRKISSKCDTAVEEQEGRKLRAVESSAILEA